jgi:hypothetical protein
VLPQSEPVRARVPYRLALESTERANAERAPDGHHIRRERGAGGGGGEGEGEGEVTCVHPFFHPKLAA